MIVRFISARCGLTSIYYSPLSSFKPEAYKGLGPVQDVTPYCRLMSETGNNYLFLSYSNSEILIKLT